MDPLSRIFAQTIENVEYLHQQGAISQESYGIIVQNLLQVEQAPPPPPVSKESLPAIGTSRSASLVSEPERKPYIVDSPSSTLPPPTPRGAVNQAIYDWGSEDKMGDVVNQLLKIHPFLSKKDRKAVAYSLRKPLHKGMESLTSPDRQAAIRSGATKGLSAAGRSTSNAFKSWKPAQKDKSKALPEVESTVGDTEIVTDDDGESRFIKTMNSAIDIAPGLVLDVTTVVRVVLDPEVLLAVDEEIRE